MPRPAAELSPMPPLPPQPADVPWPTKSWPESEPDGDVDRDALARTYRRLIEEPDEEKTGETYALLFVHRGRLVAEGYGAEYTRDSKLVSWSMAKSILHALAGILVRGGTDVSLRPTVVGALADAVHGFPAL